MNGFVVRTLDAISKAIRGDLRRELPGTDAAIWPNTLSVFAKVVAMAIQLVEFRGGYIYRQIFASTADRRHLERHAYELGLARKPAASATGFVVTTGTPGTIYPAGIAWLSGNVTYRSSSDAKAQSDGTLTLPVYSEVAGETSNRAAGEMLALLDRALYPTIGGQATVGPAGLGGGADTEDDESLRARVLDRKRRPPQGGSVSDYEQMALTVPGVTKAWAWSFANGPGTVGVWFLFDGRPNGIPTDGDVAVVADALAARRRICVRLYVSAPRPKPLDISIGGLSPDTAQHRERIAASIAAMLAERARPGVASEAFVLSRSWIGEAISRAVGEDRHRLEWPLTDLVYTSGEMPVPGTISYV